MRIRMWIQQFTSMRIRIQIQGFDYKKLGKNYSWKKRIFSTSKHDISKFFLWSSSSITPSFSYRKSEQTQNRTEHPFLMTNNLQMRFLKMPNAKLTEFLHCTPNSLLPFKPNRTVSTTVFSLFCPVQYTIHKISVISHTRKKHVSAEARPGFSDGFHFFSLESVDIVNPRIFAQQYQKQICNKNWTGLGLIRLKKVEANNNDSGFVSEPN